MNFRFSLGSLFATMTLFGAYLATAIYAIDLTSQKIAMFALPMITLLALITWKDPGLIGRIVGRIVSSCRQWMAAMFRVFF